MKTPYSCLVAALAGGVLAVGFCGIANATTTYDTPLASPGTYFGSGNPSGHWAATTTNYSGSFGTGSVEVGLKAQGRYSTSPDVLPDTGTNIYHVQTGAYGSGFCPGCAVWNIDFSVNFGTSGLDLSNVTSTLSFYNAANHQSFDVNPFNEFSSDNSAYDGSTTRDGNHATPAQPTDVGFQNSENLGFGPLLATPGFVPASFGFDPTLDDTYFVTLSLLGPSNENLGTVSETIVAGVGATPIPGTLPLFLSGIGLLGFFMYRRKSHANLAGLAAA